MATTYDLNFDGSTIYGELTHPVTFTGDFEIQVTFNTTADTVALFGESSSNDTLLYVIASGVLHARFASVTSRAATTVVNDGEDHTARMVRTGTTVELYVDGDLEATATEAVADSVVNLIGNNQFGLYFDGQIKSIKFIDKSGAEDVIQTYQINNGSTLYVPIDGGSLGSELVTDGGFDNPASWSEFAGWTVGGGVATSTGGGLGVYQDLTGWAVSGQHYLLGVTAKTLDAGRLDIRIGNGDAQNYGGILTAAGVSLGVAQWSGAGTNFNVMSLDSSFIGTADDATVKALPESIILYNVAAGDWEATVTTYPGGAARRRRARRKAQVQMMYTLNQSPILNEYYDDAVGDLR